MKLELKHLAPYLPYGLIVQWIREDDKAIIMSDLNISDYNFLIKYKRAKPILRPLSDLTKEIRHKDVDFIPVEFLIKEGFNVSDEWIESGFIDIIRSDYEFIQLLLEWHFDIYGLIENGLAVDINTLES